LNYLETDFIPGIAKFVKGVLSAGLEVAKLIAWTVGKAFEVTLEVVRGALEAGVTLTELVIETIQHPDQAMQNLIKAARELEKTWSDVVTAFKDAGEEFYDEMVRAAVAIGEDLEEMLLGVLEVVAGALDTVVFILMNLLNGFRNLTAAERADAELIFGDTIDYDLVYIATDSPTNSIIFGIQDLARDSEESRAFVTGNLINFDADDVPIKRYQLIHEMTHVWQNQNVGPIYMAHALFSQATADNGEDYNYGYNDSAVGINLPNSSYDGSSNTEATGFIDGEGGQDELNAAAGDFFEFNPEQQGQIMMQYFVRRFLLGQPPASYAAWQPYVDFVQNNPQNGI
jgi:hypothetical protein